MKLIEVIEAKNEALRVRDIARILGVSVQQIYKMAAKGQIPSFRVANAIRFDPQVFATWLREKYPSQHVTPIQRTVNRMSENASASAIYRRSGKPIERSPER